MVIVTLIGVDGGVGVGVGAKATGAEDGENNRFHIKRVVVVLIGVAPRTTLAAPSQEEVIKQPGICGCFEFNLTILTDINRAQLGLVGDMSTVICSKQRN